MKCVSSSAHMGTSLSLSVCLFCVRTGKGDCVEDVNTCAYPGPYLSACDVSPGRSTVGGSVDVMYHI